MHEHLRRCLEHYEFARREIHDLLTGLSDEQFSRRPDDGRWSMAECVDHLLQVGNRMAPRLEKAIAEGRSRERFSDAPFRYGWFEGWFVKASGADRLPPRRRFKAPRLYAPTPGLEWNVDDALEEFVQLQERLTTLTRRADGLDLRKIRISSPVTRLLRLSLGGWLAMLGGHQRRHLWQARQVRRELLNS